jgi:membrane protein
VDVSQTGRSVVARLKSTADAFLAWLQHVPGGPLLLRLISDLARSEIADRSMTLAGQAFTSILPVMIVLSTIRTNGYIDDTLGNYGLSAEDLALTSGDANQSTVTFGVIGGLMTLISATSFSRALDRMYARVWGTPKLKFSKGWRWLVVVVAISLGVTVQGLIARLGDIGTFDLIGLGLQVSADLAFWTVLWFFVCRMLTEKRVNVRCSLLTGMISAIGLTGLSLGSRVALEPILDSATSQFGILGVIFTIISWLFVFSAVLVASTVIVYALASDTGRIGHFLRTPEITDVQLGDRQAA